MAGHDYTQVNTALWSDDDWRALTSDEQWLYFLLWTHPDLSAAGVLDWRPGKLSGFAIDKGAADLRGIAVTLQHKRFILIDEDTEEVLVRPYIRRDRNRLTMPNTAKGMCRAFASTGSKRIRQVIVHEVQKAYSRTPDLKGFVSETSREDLFDLMRQPANPIESFVDLEGMGSDVDPQGVDSASPKVAEIQTGTHPGDIENGSPRRKTLDDKQRRSSEGHVEGQGSSDQDGSLAEASSAEITLIEPEQTGPSVEDFFDQFWEHWPKKMKKPDASKAFKKAVKEKRATPERIVQGAEIYSRSKLPEKQFIPHPATWLNNDQWNDLEPHSSTSAPPGLPSIDNPGAFTNWSLDDYRPWASRPHVVEAQERVDDARSRGEEPNDDDLRIVAGPDGG